jgi:hypothetical protein
MAHVVTKEALMAKRKKKRQRVRDAVVDGRKVAERRPRESYPEERGRIAPGGQRRRSKPTAPLLR